MEISILNLITLFIVYSFLGWVIESTFKSICERKIINTGFLYGPFCPIYGIGAIIMLLFLERFKNNIILLFLAGFFVLSIWEYIVGWILEKAFKTTYWDYSDHKFNIKGRVWSKIEETIPQIQVSREDKIIKIIIVALPIVVIATGIVVWIIRKRKK